jgi:RNA polymerase primary sigma factor
MASPISPQALSELTDNRYPTSSTKPLPSSRTCGSAPSPGLDCGMNGDEQLRAYLEAVDRLPPLGEHEVRELGETIQRGNQAGNLLEGGSLASQEATAAKQLEARGQAARKRLIEGNLRLVVTVADDYRDQSLSQEELLNAGNVGLVRAVERYDWQQRSGFASSAITLIRDAITAAIRDRS